MIMNALSVVGFSDTTIPLTSTWYLDSVASNHMTFSPSHLSNLKTYDGNLRVHIADGCNVSITSVGDVSHPPPLNHVFFFLHI